MLLRALLSLKQPGGAERHHSDLKTLFRGGIGFPARAASFCTQGVKRKNPRRGGNPVFHRTALCAPGGDDSPISAGRHPSLWELGWFLSNKMRPGSFCWCTSGPPECRCVPVETPQRHSERAEDERRARTLSSLFPGRLQEGNVAHDVRLCAGGKAEHSTAGLRDLLSLRQRVEVSTEHTDRRRGLLAGGGREPWGGRAGRSSAVLPHADPSSSLGDTDS